MSSQLRQCREGLAKALGLKTNHVSEINYNSTKPGSFFSVPDPLFTHHIDLHYNLCLALMDHSPVLTNHKADCRQRSEHDPEDFTVSDPEHQDLPALIGIPSINTLDELIAKLEFENKFNRVCNRVFPLNVNTPPVQGDSTGNADSIVEKDGFHAEEDEEDVRLINMVLDMEQDYKLFVH